MGIEIPAVFGVIPGVSLEGRIGFCEGDGEDRVAGLFRKWLDKMSRICYFIKLSLGAIGFDGDRRDGDGASRYPITS